MLHYVHRKPYLHTDFQRLHITAMRKCVKYVEMECIIFYHLLFFNFVVLVLVLCTEIKTVTFLSSYLNAFHGNRNRCVQFLVVPLRVKQDQPIIQLAAPTMFLNCSLFHNLNKDYRATSKNNETRCQKCPSVYHLVSAPVNTTMHHVHYMQNKR